MNNSSMIFFSIAFFQRKNEAIAPLFVLLVGSLIAPEE